MRNGRASLTARSPSSLPQCLVTSRFQCAFPCSFRDTNYRGSSCKIRPLALALGTEEGIPCFKDLNLCGVKFSRQFHAQGAFLGDRKVNVVFSYKKIPAIAFSRGQFSLKKKKKQSSPSERRKTSSSKRVDDFRFHSLCMECDVAHSDIGIRSHFVSMTTVRFELRHDDDPQVEIYTYICTTICFLSSYHLGFVY